MAPPTEAPFAGDVIATAGGAPAVVLNAADDIKEQTEIFAKQDGSELSGVDSLIPQTAKGTAYQPKKP